MLVIWRYTAVVLTYLLHVVIYKIIWTPCSKKLERIHSQFCTLLSDLQGSLHHTLTECRRFHTAIVVYRTLHQLSPDYLRNIFRYTIAVTSHTGRNIHRPFVPRVRTTYGKTSLYFKGTQVWNALDASLYTAATLGQFKHMYKLIYL